MDTGWEEQTTPTSAPSQYCVKLLQQYLTLSTQGPLSGDSPGKNPGVGCHALLQGIFPTQGSNPALMSPALGRRFFSTSTVWEALLPSN